MNLSSDQTVDASQSSRIDVKLYVVGLALIWALCAIGAWHPLNNYSDFWAHAAIGRWIIENHWHAPKHSLLLWSANSPWIAHSWLSEALIYLLLRHYGDYRGAAVAICIVGVIAAVSFAVLWRVCRINSRNFGPALLVFSVAIYGTSGRLFARPEIFSVLFFAVLLGVLLHRDLATSRDQRKSSYILLGGVLGLMFVFWTNLHGGVLVGLVTIWIYAIVGLIQDSIPGASRPALEGVGRGKDAKAMVVVAAVCTLATLVNPYGYHYYAIYKAVTTLTFSHIVEWRPLFGFPPIQHELLVPILLLIAGAAVLWFLTPSRRWAHFAWLIAFTAMAVDARRNVGFVNLAAVAAAVPYLWSIGREPEALPAPARGRGGAKATAEASTGIGRTARRGWAIAAGFVYLLMAWFSLDWIGNLDSPSALSPDVAKGLCSAVKAIGIHGHVLNDYDTASYLEWELNNDPELFIDGLNAYPDSLFTDYMYMLRAYPAGLKMLDDDHINCIIGRGRVGTEPDFPTLYIVAAHSPAWALVYYGDDGPVFVRRLPEYRKFWEGVPIFAGGNKEDFKQYLRTESRLRGRITMW